MALDTSVYWTTLEISAPRCALMCYPSSNITYCIACLLCIGVILLNKFNSVFHMSRALTQWLMPATDDRVVAGWNPSVSE